MIRSEGLPTFNLGLSGSTRATFVLWQSVIHVAPTLCVPLITSFKPPLIAYPNVAVVQKVRIVHKKKTFTSYKSTKHFVLLGLCFIARDFYSHRHQLCDTIVTTQRRI